MLFYNDAQSRAINLVTRFSYISALPEQEHGGKMKIPGKEVVKPACNCVNQNVPDIGKLRRVGRWQI